MYQNRGCLIFSAGAKVCVRNLMYLFPGCANILKEDPEVSIDNV